MIRSRYILSLFFFCFLSNSLFSGEGQQSGGKTRRAKKGQNNNTSQELAKPESATDISGTTEHDEVFSPRPNSSRRSLSRHSSHRSFSEEESSPQRTKSVDSNSSTNFHIRQASSSSSSGSSLTHFGQSTSTAIIGSSLVTTTAPASVATNMQNTQTTAPITTTTTTITTNTGPRLEANWWTWAQEKAEALRYDRTVVLTALRNKTFRDKFHTPMLKFTKIGNAINETLVEEDKRGDDDLLLRCDEFVDGAKEHDVEILAAQKTEILARVNAKIARLEALRKKIS